MEGPSFPQHHGRKTAGKLNRLGALTSSPAIKASSAKRSIFLVCYRQDSSLVVGGSWPGDGTRVQCLYVSPRRSGKSRNPNWRPRQESNLDLRFRKPLFYPLNYGD